MEIFTLLYDELMDPLIYENWLAFFEREIGPPHQTVLDLGCGSGVLTLALKEKGYEITGVDLSEEMLMEAYNRQVTRETYFPLVQRDMRDLSDLPTYDVIVSSLDSLCYLPDFPDVQTVFQEVYTHLNEEGTFLFDVHSFYQMTEVYPGYQYHAEGKDYFFAWSSYFGEEVGSVIHDLTVFEHQGEATYLRQDKTITERSYPLQNYLEALKKAGFTEIKCAGDDGQSEVEETSQRWYFSCVKRGSQMT